MNHGRDVGLLSGRKLVVLGLHKSVTVFDYDARSYDMHRSAVDPALVDLAMAYYQTAFDLFTSHHYLLPLSSADDVAHSVTPSLTIPLWAL